MTETTILADRRAAAVLALRSSDPVVRRRLGYGAFVGVRHPYLYLETPKAACTTTKAHLWRLEDLGPLRPSPTPPTPPTPGRRRTRARRC